MLRTFGVLERFGYQERWVAVEVRGSAGQVDVFSSDVVGGERREGIWMTADTVFPCTMRVDSYVWYEWWGEQVGDGGAGQGRGSRLWEGESCWWRGK